MNAVFIIGTDTGTGKTIIAGLLADYFFSKGNRVITQKWVATGGAGDIDVHLKIGRFNNTRNRDCVVPYSFKFAASPHLAAELEQKSINEKKIKKSFLELLNKYDRVIVEGTGGILVPINRKKLLIDIVKDLKLPVILAVHNKLGAINHTLMSVEALKKRGIPIIGAVFNDLSKTKEIILKDNLKIIKELSGVEILGRLPKSNSMKMLKDKFEAIGNKIEAFYSLGKIF